MKRRFAWMAIALMAAGAGLFAADLNSGRPYKIPPVKPAAVPREMTIDDAVAIALHQNPNILRAIQTIEQTRGLIIEVRAQALPHLSVVGNYQYEQKTLLVSPASGGAAAAASTTPAASTSGSSTESSGGSSSSSSSGASGADTQNWTVMIEASQLIYSGGEVAAAIKIARLGEDSSYYSLRDTIDQTISTVQQQFYAVVLDRALIKVQEESIRLLESELKDQQNRFSAGTVPRFNVLQADVALALAQPNLITARNNLLIAQVNLDKTLGIERDPNMPQKEAYNVVGEMPFTPYPINLKDSILQAKANRPFLKVQRLNILIQVQQIKVELSGYQPTVQATGGYEIRNSPLTTALDQTVEGWFFGVNGTWNIFDGGATYGRVKQAKAALETAKITYDDSSRQVELDVQQAAANFTQSVELYQSQVKNVEEAAEALRLATDRLTAGVGTQLDVLNAQVALTQARSTELQARYSFDVANAEFLRVTGAATKYTEGFDDPVVRKWTAAERAGRTPP